MQAVWISDEIHNHLQTRSSAAQSASWHPDRVSPHASAENASDSDRLQKLEEAVQLLQKSNADLQRSNAELKAEVSRLRKSPRPRQSRKRRQPKPKSLPPRETLSRKHRRSRPERVTDGNSRRRSPSLKSLGIFGCVTNTAPGKLATRCPPAQPTGSPAATIGKSANGNVIGFASVCEAPWRMIGSSESGSRRARIRARPTSPLATTPPGAATATNNGPFSKVSDGINVGPGLPWIQGIFRGHVSWAGECLSSSVLITTRMVWDDDINPEGLSEQWKHSFLFGVTRQTLDQSSKDSKECRDNGEI